MANEQRRTRELTDEQYLELVFQGGPNHLPVADDLILQAALLLSGTESLPAFRVQPKWVQVDFLEDARAFLLDGMAADG